MSTQISGLHFIALALGYGIGSQITARLNDGIYKRLKARRGGGKGIPEFRIPVMIPCAILLPVGFFWYGWSAEARIFWIMPDIGAAILAAAMICGYQASKSVPYAGGDVTADREQYKPMLSMPIRPMLRAPLRV